MKKMFEKVFAEFKAHKIIDGLIVLFFVACIMMISLTAHIRGVAAASSAAIASEMKRESSIQSISASSAAASSSETSSATVSSSTVSSAAVSSSSTAASSSAAAVVAPAKTSSTVSKATTSKTASSKVTTSKAVTSSAAINPLYTAISYGSAEELKTKSMGGGTFTLNINAFGIYGTVSSKDARDYMCDDVYFTVTQNGTNKVMTNSVSGEVGDNNEVDVSSGLESYQHGSRYWLKPATYTVHVYCQKGNYSMNTTSGRPDKVDICTFNFSVYERGFKS